MSSRGVTQSNTSIEGLSCHHERARVQVITVDWDGIWEYQDGNDASLFQYVISKWVENVQIILEFISELIFAFFLTTYILMHCVILHLIEDFSPTASGSHWKVNWTLQVQCALMSWTSGKRLACRLQPPPDFLCKTSYQKQCLWFFKINILSVSFQFYNSGMPFSQTGQPSVWGTRKTIYLLSVSLLEGVKTISTSSDE